MRLFYLLIAAALIAAIAGSTLGQLLRPPPSSSVPSSERTSRLVVRLSDLDFGEAWETGRFQWAIHVANPGDQAVHVLSWQTSCDCLSAEPASATLEPGQSLTVSLSLNLLQPTSTVWTDKPRKVEIRLTPRFKDDADGVPLEWRIVGTVKPFCRPVSEASRSSRSERAQSATAGSFDLEFVVPVQDVRVRAESPITHVSVTPLSDNLSGHRVEYHWDKNIPVGSYSPKVVVTAHTAHTVDGHELPRLNVVRYLDVVDDIKLSPPQLMLAAERQGTAVAETVQVYSLTGRACTLLGVDGQLPDGLRVAIRGDQLEVTGRLPVIESPFMRSLTVTVSSDGRSYRVPLQIIGGPRR